MRANPLIEFVNLADNRGPDQRRSGPTRNEFAYATSKHRGHLSWGPASVLIHTIKLCAAVWTGYAS